MNDRERSKQIEIDHALLRSLIEAIPDPVCVTDSENRFIINNRAHLDLLGVSHQEKALGKTVSDFFPPADASSYFATSRAVRKSGTQILNQEEKVVDPRSGKIRWFLVNKAPLMGIPGEQGWVVAILREITERRKAQKALHEHQRFLNAVLETIQDGISVLDRDLTIRHVNHAMNEWYQQSLPLIGKKCYEAYHGRSTPCPSCPTLRCLETGKTEHEEAPALAGSSIEWVEVFSYPMTSRDSGEVTGVVEFVRNITERKHSEQALRESEAHAQTTLNSIGDAVITTDIDGKIIGMNPVAELLTGWTLEEQKGNPLSSVFAILDAQSRKPVVDPVQRVLDSNEIVGLANHALLRSRNGTEYHIANSAAPIRDRNGKTTGVVLAFRDVSEEYRIQSALRESQARLEYFFSQSLDGFFFMMLDEPVAWNETTDKEQVLDYVMTHQRMTKVNQALLDQYRAQENQFLRLTPSDLFRHDLKHGREIWRGLFDRGRWQVETNQRRLDGTPMWVEGDYICMYDSQDRITGHFGVQSDVTEQKAVQEALRQSENKFRQIVTNIEDILYSLEAETREISYISPAFEKVLGYTMDDIRKEGGWQAFMASVLQDNAYVKQVNAFEVVKSERRKEQCRFEAWWRCKDGSQKCLEDIWTPIYEGDILIGTSGVLRDITERKKHEEQIRRLSFYDPLTNLYNRAFMEENIHRLGDSRELPLGVILCDVNGLKLVNDGYGHRAGDTILQRFAQALKESCRKEELVGRWGSDEFIILLPHGTETVLQTLLNRIESHCQRLSTERLPLSISSGWAIKTEVEQSIDSVITLAEERMNRNKLTENRSARSSILASLERTLRETTEETREHAHRMRELARRVGAVLGLSGDELADLELLARLHDLGKIAIPPQILNKPGPLDPEEWMTIKKHPEVGYRIALSSPDLVPIAESILSHHERFDGKGYPQGLSGEAIPLLARIIAVVDSFDVMISGRPYKAACSSEEAVRELERCTGTQFDSRVVQALVATVTRHSSL